MTSHTPHPDRSLAPTPLAGRRSIIASRLLGAACLASLALAGCQHADPTRVAGWELTDPSERHPILVSQKPAAVLLRVARGSTGLSPHGRAELLEFASRYRQTDSGSRLVIEAPSGSANEVAAVSAVDEIRALLRERGIAESDIAVEAYNDDRDPQPPIRVSFMRYVAEGPDCPNWSANLARDPDNLPTTNLGCATQHNFAAQIANPADLLGPRASDTPRNNDRRQAVWAKYIKGETTGAQKSDEEKTSTKIQN